MSKKEKSGKVKTPVRSREAFEAKETWRIFKIMSEFVDAFEELKGVGKAVTMWGSARAKPGSKYYKMTYNLAKILSEAGYSVITGGGPGLMEAANKGAKKGRGLSVGLNIDIPSEQLANPHLDLMVEFKYFFVRKVMFVKYACAFIIMPGGYGTMDELFEALTLIQTEKSPLFPVILVGREYWSPLVDWLKKTVIKAGHLGQQDLKFFTITDDPAEVLSIIQNWPHTS